MSKESHNRGQEDASKGEYHKPNNEAERAGGLIMDILMPFGGSLLDKMDKDNDDYDKGQKNTRDQKSGR
jgi:hypothetical protein